MFSHASLRNVVCAPYGLCLRHSGRSRVCGIIEICREKIACNVMTGLRSRCISKRINRPLSRRLDRCDRVIQSETKDPFGGNVYYTSQCKLHSLRANSGMCNVICIVT